MVASRIGLPVSNLLILNMYNVQRSLQAWRLSDYDKNFFD